MKAVICKRYGPPESLQMTELEKPVPKDNEVLIRIAATSAHIGDTRIRRADPFLVRLVFGLLKPRKNLVLGLEVSGVVESVGKNVTAFQKNDPVFALTGFGLGGYAEYICLPEKVKSGTEESKGLITLKPRNLSFKEAAVVPAGALTALKNLQKARLSKGQEILINGASGSLGTYAIQLARYFGAKVTAVCSAQNADFVRSLGADHVIDYRSTDFTAGGRQYDVVYDAVMKRRSSDCRKALKKTGIFLNNMALPAIVSNDLQFLKDLIEQNALKPVIDKVYPLNDIVQAHRYVDMGHKKGNVAITVQPLS